jgi:hypothetical protein
MNFETKYNLLDTVYHLDDGIVESEIRDIQAESYFLNGEIKIVVKYRLLPRGKAQMFWIAESKLFKTKEEVGTEWLKSQGLECGIRGVKL